MLKELLNNMSLDEFLDEVAGFGVRNLLQRMLHRVSGDRDEGAADLPVPRQTAGPDRIDRASGAVRGVFDRKAQLDI